MNLAASIAIAAVLTLINSRKSRLNVMQAFVLRQAPVTAHKHYCDAARDIPSSESYRRMRVLRTIDIPALAITALQLGANDPQAIAIRRACRT
jgi:hypothetical protein